jgi:glycosyltransferase involved in cell wall biosynthesis
LNLDKESLKLVHVITPGDHFSPRTGSAIPTVVHGLSSALNSRDLKSMVVVDATTYTPRYESCDVVEVAYNLAPMRKSAKLSDVLTGALFNSRQHIVSRYRPVRAELEHLQNAVVFYHNAVAPCAIHKSQHPRHMVYSWWHNDLSRTLTNRELCHYIAKIDGLICCSHFLRTKIIKHLPANLSRKVHVVQNGVDLPVKTSHSRVISGRPTIGFVGRVTPEKGVHLILEAVASNKILRETCDVVIVGNHGFSATDPLTTYEEGLRAIAGKAELSVRFLPFQNRFEIPDIYSNIDILVVPSVFPEPFGLVVLEANSYGIPVIHSASGGLLEASGGQSPVFDIENHIHLAEQLVSLLESAELYRDCSERSLSWSALSTWDARCEGFMQIFQRS